MAKNKPGKLTPKQQRFVDAYTGEAKGNGAQAARLAGYKGTPAALRTMAQENLAKPLIAAAIAAITEEMRAPLIASRKERQALLTKMLRESVTEEVVVTVGTGMGCSQIEKTRKDISARDRLKALELLGKMQGDFIERVEVKSAEWMRGMLVRLRKRAEQGELKHLTAEAVDELLKEMAQA